MTSKIRVVRDPSDAVAHTAPVTWAISHLRETLAARGLDCEESRLPGGPGAGAAAIVVASPASAAAAELRSAGITLPATAEALALAPGMLDGKPATLACGSDARGLVYAVLELADRAAHAADPFKAVTSVRAVAEQPANPVRGIARLFVSDVEDKPWYYDRGFWRTYLTTLISERFNRFHLAFGIGHDFVRNVLDAYFLFAYPFLVNVPGYHVRAVGLPDEERDRNLAMLRFISDEAAVRGLHFQLGLWMHAYEWVDSPRANYTISGLTAENHAAYCRDALQLVLDACPNIAAITFRIHGESGVAEGSHDFWRTVFSGALRPGRRIEINLHPKGMDQETLELALATGLPVTISPKYTAEHMGLPYQQASIRDLERDAQRQGEDTFVSNLMNKSAGSLRYTRYGYADFLKADRRYGLFYRVWPGTDRLLLWGDPALAAGFGRHSHFSGSLGMELCEPLSFKGRLGSGLPGGRNAYADKSLRPAYDFQKYLYSYRLYGRLMYNPDADPGQWQRYLGHEFGSAAPAVEQALANASRILPLVTTSHIPSCHYGWFWPEIYTHMAIVDATLPHHYRDTDEPKLFGNVSALDPVLFSKPEEFADEVVQRKSSGRYSPLRVAAWLDSFAAEAERSLAEAAVQAGATTHKPEFCRLAIDVAIESGLGRFYANELRASTAYALYRRTRELGRLRQAAEAYRAARCAWVSLVQTTTGVYRDDITFGLHPCVRGHWADRLPALDADLAAMEAELQAAEAAATPEAKAAAGRIAPLAALDQAAPAIQCSHTPPAPFVPGQPVPIALTVDPHQERGLSVRLHYRHVNQAEDYQTTDMVGSGGIYQATIPAGYTGSPYGLLYFFDLHNQSGKAWLYPAFSATLDNQPYFDVPQAKVWGPPALQKALQPCRDML